MSLSACLSPVRGKRLNELRYVTTARRRRHVARRCRAAHRGRLKVPSPCASLAEVRDSSTRFVVSRISLFAHLPLAEGDTFDMKKTESLASVLRQTVERLGSCRVFGTQDEVC